MAKNNKNSSSSDQPEGYGEVPGLPLPEATQTEENPGVSPSDVNKDTGGAQPQGNTTEVSPDVNPNE
jgi:hypothetical protein